ncbi:hypothetical protein LTR78_010860 [Recurvomyces mirabilis]|uniref:Acetyl-CoA synthetase-like protein n=1 Tax=Recurvomyces mirabilis TaxID=574656 RepID=A0AAE0TLX0_9PEZI|nr:hypothetical protein LTR78_010860 [Recurvomyces mirabilis]KAK5162372.1 hypothetical protein LTS14_000719 [Recurvomyces mirabilis]
MNSLSNTNTLPNFPLFVRLLGFAHRFGASHDAILDLKSGSAHSHIQLLTDVLSLRLALLRTLDARAKQRLQNDDGEAFFLLLAQPSYEYVVGFLAILAIGGIIVPVSAHAPLRELKYFAIQTPPLAVIYHPSCRTAVSSLARDIAVESNARTPTIDILDQCSRQPLAPGDIHVAPFWSLHPERPGLVIYTSGTTGPPKAVLLQREILSSGTLALADHFQLTTDDVLLHCMPLHHIAGITVCFVPFLLAGARIEFTTFDVQPIWQRWKDSGVTVFGGVPTMYNRLLREYEDNIKSSPNQKTYIGGLRQLRFLMSGTSALPAPLQRKWSDLTGGKPILERYGATEFSTAILTPLRPNGDVPAGSVGKVLSGCEVKLANGNDSEILIKAPGMFTGYHNDPAGTRKSFDAQGFFKTGDIGRREGEWWFISGRASIDIIKTGGYKVSALDVERELSALPYVSEAAVVGVSDDDLGQRVAAIVILRDAGTLDLSQLRDDLRGSLSSYKLPTLLCVVEHLPRTASGKVKKVEARKEIFEGGRNRAYVVQSALSPRNSSARPQARL